MDSIGRIAPAESFETIVVDSKSSDSTADYLRGITRQVRDSLRLRVLGVPDRGWPSAVNQGISSATGQWLAITNPDIIFTEDFNRLLRWVMARSIHGVNSVDLQSPDGSRITALHKVTTARLFFGYTKLGRWLDKKFLSSWFKKTFGYRTFFAPAIVDHPICSFLLVHSEVFRKVGLLDERYFLYFSDSDWVMRVKNAHIPVIHFPQFTFLHGVSYSQQLRPKRNLDRIFNDGMFLYARDWCFYPAFLVLCFLDRMFCSVLGK